MNAATQFRDRLLTEGWLIDGDTDGVYGFGGAFEHLLGRLDAFITALGQADAASVMRFPPGIARTHFERSGYMHGFAHLAGTVHCFDGDHDDHQALLGAQERGEDWTTRQRACDVVLSPAACYPVYPALAARGPLAAGGAVVDVASHCFRHEPSRNPARMQFFRMREYVRVGSEADVLAFRSRWMERSGEILDALMLDGRIDVANDPFFGRASRLLGELQRAGQAKFELLIPAGDPSGEPTACISFNYHQDRFARIWPLVCADGEPAHTACVAFGMERLVLALAFRYGLDFSSWPGPLHQRLALLP